MSLRACGNGFYIARSEFTQFHGIKSLVFPSIFHQSLFKEAERLIAGGVILLDFITLFVLQVAVDRNPQNNEDKSYCYDDYDVCAAVASSSGVSAHLFRNRPLA